MLKAIGEGGEGVLTRGHDVLAILKWGRECKKSPLKGEALKF